MQPNLRKARPYRPERLSLLAYDDSIYARSILTEILRGVDVREPVIARSEAEFVELLLKRRFDAVLMPEAFEGAPTPEFIRKLRANPTPTVAQVPLVIMSAQVTKESLLAARNAGVDEFLAKPIAPAALEARLKSICETPRPFIDCPVYVGPCRRRKLTLDYKGPRRRIADKTALVGQIDDGEESAPKGRLAQLVDRLQLAVGEAQSKPDLALPVIRKVLSAIHGEAVDKSDLPSERAARALMAFIDGRGLKAGYDQNLMETGANALSQLLLLSEKFGPARETVADALELAVRKKLSDKVYVAA